MSAQSGSVKVNLGGLAGDGEVNLRWNGSNKTHCNVWLGEMSEDDVASVANGTVDCSVMVGNKGVFAPGLIGYDGGRRGLIRVPYNETAADTPVMRAFLMQEGGTFIASVNADGTCGCLDASQTQTEGKYLSVMLAGTLDIREYGKIQTGVAYPVVFYHPGSLTGKFSRKLINGAAPSGASYEVKYDVPQDDGSYAVTVTRRPNGTVMIVR